MGTGYGDLSSDDYRPPPDWYKTASANKVLAEEYARVLNDLADDFDNSALVEGYGDELREKAGQKIIGAYRQGFLRSVPNLGKFVEWHTASNENDPVVGVEIQARRARCATNLFIDIIGGHMANVRNDGGKITFLGPKLDDGILPAIDPHLFKRGDGAAACRFLANTILRESASEDGPWSEPDLPSQWAKRFNISTDTFKRRVGDGTIRCKKLSPKSYRIHQDDLPPQ